MATDRYLKIILTVIALELGWIAVKDTAAVQVSAQQNDPMPVLIRGVDLLVGKDAPLPISLVRSTTPVRVVAERTLPVETQRPVVIVPERPIVVETASQRPLLIQSVPAGTAPRPGPGE